MSTRSQIAIMDEGGKVRSVYCHSDGYLEWNGVKLQNHYNSREMAEKLIAGGNISCLYEHIDAPAGHSFENRVEGHTVFYGRDRGEEGQEARTYDGIIPWMSMLRSNWAEFAYIWVNDEWYVSQLKYDVDDCAFMTDLRPLATELDKVVSEVA